MGKSWRKKKTPGGRSLNGGTLHLFEHNTLPAAILAQLEKAYKFGHHFVTFSALDICVQANLPLPPWLAQAVLQILKQALDVRPDVKAWASDQVHLQRYKSVLKHRDNGATWSEAYDSAADDGRGQLWSGTPETMHKSYVRVKRTIDKNPGRYWHPQDAYEAIETIFRMMTVASRMKREGKPLKGLRSGWRGWSYSPAKGEK